MPEQFFNRLDPSTYTADVEVQVRLDPDPRDERAKTTEAWISERLLNRLRHLGLAYELPLLSRLPVQDEWSYPEVQCSSLENEIVFVLNLVSSRHADHQHASGLAPRRRA
jgi:hypothetical protein